MSSLPHCAALMAGALCVALTCVDVHAQPIEAEFKFPHNRGSLRLRDEPCRDARIIRLYEGDVPEPFLAGRLDLKGRVLSGCWYRADEHVFFTDSEGDLLVPVPPVSSFSPTPSRLQTTGAVNPVITPLPLP